MKTTTFEIRPFRPDTDNAGVLAVAGGLGIPARVQLGLDRSPEFTAFDTWLGDPFEVLVAEAGGEIVGFVEMSLAPFMVLGESDPGMHLPLGGVRADWRRRGVLKALVEAAIVWGRRNGARWGYLLVNAGNKGMQQYLRQFIPGMIELDRLLVHGIVWPWRPGQPGGDYEIGPLQEEEWPRLMDFARDVIRDRDLYPLIREEKWRSLPGCTHQDFWVARDRTGRIVASLGSFDPYVAKRVLILGYGKWEHRLLGPVNKLLRLRGIRPFPSPGGDLHNLYALLPLARPGHEAALGQLLFRLRTGRRDCNMVLAAFPAGDPRNRLVRRYLHFTNVNIPVLSGLTPDDAQLLKARPPRSFYLEYGFI